MSWRATVRKDGVVVAILAVLAIVGALRYLAAFRAAGGVPQFYQEMFGPAVMEACGRGFINPVPQAASSAGPFLAGAVDAFDCGLVPPTVASMPLTAMQDVHRYLLMTSAVFWRMLGVRWSALDWLTAGLYAATAVALYLACRLVAGTILSSGLTVLAILSPLQLANLPNIRDYSKALFFVAGAAGVVWLMTPRRPRSILMVACGTGALMGVGLGFRTDVMMYLLPLLAGLLACSPDGAASPWRTRIAACALCTAAFVALSWPILRVYSSGQTLWHVALLGLTTPFDDSLGVRRSLYDFGDQYRDGYVTVIANSYWARVHHAPITDGATYAAATGEYYRQLFMSFPADFLTRAWAAVVKSLDLPTDLHVATVVPFGVTSRWLGAVFWYRWWALSWIEGLPLLLLVALAVGLSARRVLPGVFLIGFVVFSAGLTSVQFQPRHFFHLETVAYWVIAAAGGWLTRSFLAWKRRTSSAANPGGFRIRPALIFAGSLIVLVVLPFVLLRAWQQRTVSALLTRYESAALSSVDVGERSSNGTTYLGMPSLRSTSDARAFTQMVVTTLDTGACDAPIELTYRYTADPEGQSDFTRSIHINPREIDARTVRVLFPVNFAIPDLAPRLAFVGLEVPDRQRHCIRAIARFSTPEAFPLLLTTMLVEDWRRMPLYERIDPIEFHPSMVSPFVGKIWYRTRRLLSL